MLREIDQWLIGMTVLFYRPLLTVHWRYTQAAGRSMIGFLSGWGLPEVRTVVRTSE